MLGALSTTSVVNQSMLLAASNNQTTVALATTTNTSIAETTENPSLLSALGHLGIGLGRQMLQREIRYGLGPDIRRHAAILRNRTPMTALSANQALQQWHDLRVTRGELWVDLGSGDSVSLGAIARAQTGHFIGIDKENSTPLQLEVSQSSGINLEALPSNVRYLLMSWNKPGRENVKHDRLESVRMLWEGSCYADQAKITTLSAIGLGNANIVSMLFPYTESGKRTKLGRIIRGPIPQTLQFQIDTAVDLLTTGGTGVMVLEDSPRARELEVSSRALHYLRSRPELSEITFSQDPIATSDLGIAAYAPKNRRGKAVDTAVELDQGLLIFFRKKAQTTRLLLP